MERTRIIEILEKQGYPKFMIDNTVKKIEAFAPSIAAAFCEWIENSTTPQFELQGYSYNKLCEEYNMKPVGAFITLDWLTREPEVAVATLKRGVK